jgi:hypothetical protein
MRVLSPAPIHLPGDRAGTRGIISLEPGFLQNENFLPQNRYCVINGSGLMVLSFPYYICKSYPQQRTGVIP